ncbi:hypothetical protein [Methylococcus sp. EFPC2]|uniref:hypothetical protein n=1 Tax=Methylococcus sp. EFPC2 TaxID=2812648 RepID=UPI001967064C|nr:hypothetical protein [Methylococcus sp. EFPC2]QSA96531.1 hypothetical protein JWZ97_15090 [Methylococcus sp. EFPC2]
MNICKGLFLLAWSVFSSVAYPQEAESIPVSHYFSFHNPLYLELRVPFSEIVAFSKIPQTRHALFDIPGDHDADDSNTEADPVADYKTSFPHKTQPNISRFEKAILTAYLEKPDDVVLAKFLALYHLNKSLLRKTGGEAVRHTVIAQYFLNRALDLGGRSAWLRDALAKTDGKINSLISRESADEDYAANLEDGHAAHQYFRTAFFDNHEENRYSAVEKLFSDFASHPKNLFTNVYLTTSGVWVGGEAIYEDPTVLYNFVIASYFSVRSRVLAEEAEVLWREDPEHNKRFRLATFVGGWTVPARRWLAKLHGDAAAIKSLDAEHNKWLAINPEFHSGPVGLLMFEEKENFAEGFAAYELGRKYCFDIVSNNLTCTNWPYASHNILAFILGEVDFYLKAGLVDEARNILTVRHIPIDILGGDFQYWDLGREAWIHREDNLERIAELYANDDPSDDPTNFLLNEHKWGPSTINCQGCHQRQGKVWPEGEVERVLSIVDEFPPIGEGKWPTVSTTWYGSSQKVHLNRP